MDQTCETGCSKFIDYLKSANGGGGVQKHGAWMSDDRCDPWPLSSTSSRYPETGNESRFQLVAPQGKHRLIIMSFSCNAGSLTRIFNQFPNKTLSSLFGTKSTAKGLKTSIKSQRRSEFEHTSDHVIVIQVFVGGEIDPESEPVLRPGLRKDDASSELIRRRRAETKTKIREPKEPTGEKVAQVDSTSVGPVREGGMSRSP